MVDAGGVVTGVVGIYDAFLGSMPASIQNFVNLFLIILVVVIYAVFIWKLYRFVAKKDIFELNLNRYNKLGHPLLAQVVAIALYLLEYVIIMPFLVFFWFGAFTLFLLILTNNLPLHTILTVSVIVIASVRMTAYIPRYGEDLAKEIAKLLPLNLLAIAFLSQGATFKFGTMLANLSEIPSLFGTIFNYLVFIFILEIILRFFEFILRFFGLYDENEKDEK